MACGCKGSEVCGCSIAQVAPSRLHGIVPPLDGSATRFPGTSGHSWTSGNTSDIVVNASPSRGALERAKQGWAGKNASPRFVPMAKIANLLTNSKAPIGGKGTLIVDMKGPGVGRIKSNKLPVVDTIRCLEGYEAAAGSVTCPYSVEAELSEDAGTILLVHIVRNIYNIGKECSGKSCPCAVDKLTLVEFAEFDKKIKYKEELLFNALGTCGCSIHMEGLLHLVSSKSPLYDILRSELGSRVVSRATTVLDENLNPVPNNQIEAGVLGNSRPIDTGFWNASYFGETKGLTNLLTKLIEASMDSAVETCGAAWNCCGEQKRRIVDQVHEVVRLGMVAGPERR